MFLHVKGVREIEIIYVDTSNSEDFCTTTPACQTSIEIFVFTQLWPGC